MELKANELRIGNLIEINAPITNKIIVVDVYHISELKKNKDFFKPIPLTEEWLFKFGFEKRKERDNFYYFGFGKNPITKDWILCLKYFKDENIFFFMNGFHIIKYVHQLQNLYFALTNKEL